jgi:hypothetical protein
MRDRHHLRNADAPQRGLACRSPKLRERRNASASAASAGRQDRGVLRVETLGWRHDRIRYRNSPVFVDVRESGPVIRRLSGLKRRASRAPAAGVARRTAAHFDEFSSPKMTATAYEDRHAVTNRRMPVLLSVHVRVADKLHGTVTRRRCACLHLCRNLDP